MLCCVICVHYVHSLKKLTCRNPIPMPTPPTTPTFSCILAVKISKHPEIHKKRMLILVLETSFCIFNCLYRQPEVWIFMAASVSERARTPFPHPVIEERQQESGTSSMLENVTLLQSRYSWAPQQSN